MFQSELYLQSELDYRRDTIRRQFTTPIRRRRNRGLLSRRAAQPTLSRSRTVPSSL